MRLLTRSLVLSFGAGLLAAPAFAQDLTLVYKETEGGATSSRYYTRDRMRTNSPERDTIVEYATGKITTIDHRKKEYSEFILAEAEARMTEAAAEMDRQRAQMKQQMENMPPAVREKMEKMMGGIADSVTVTKGGTRTVAGYECQEYVIAMGQSMKTSTCNTTSLALPIPVAELRRFTSFASGIAGNPLGNGSTKLADKMKDVQGIALAESTSLTLLGQMKTSGREAVQVKQGPVDPAVFALPAGYKKVQPPFLTGGQG